MLNMYPGTDRVYRENMSEKIGGLKMETYEKIGGKWKIVSRECSELTPAIYCNSVDAIPFFRNLGGYERIEMNYTRLAYLPVVISSINPDRTKKVVRTFLFD